MPFLLQVQDARSLDVRVCDNRHLVAALESFGADERLQLRHLRAGGYHHDNSSTPIVDAALLDDGPD